MDFAGFLFRAVADGFIDSSYPVMGHFRAIVLAIVEGLTEYIPISSTGHLILTQAFLQIPSSEFTKIYIVNIQFGAVLAVIALYWRRFFQSLDFYFKLLVAFIPAGVVGFLLHKQIHALLSSVTTVAISLIAGGLVLIVVDRFYRQQIVNAGEDEDTVLMPETDEFGVEIRKPVLKVFTIGWMQAFIIGSFQCLAMIPGVSRSAATIVGGLQQKLNIKRSAEFSFFLAVPTIFAASFYELYKGMSHITATNIDLLLIGNALSFLVGMIAIKFFIGLIMRYGLKYFGYYRIAVGVFILILMAIGYKLEIPE